MEWLTGIDGSLVYIVVAMLAFGESAAFLGLVLPGEVGLLAAGAAAAAGSAALAPLIAIAIGFSILGAVLGYGLGVRWGPAMLSWGPVQRRLGSSADHVLRHLESRGEIVVVLSRFNSVTRALVPALAGSAGMPLRRFIASSTVGGVFWSLVFVIGGYAAGASWRAISAGSMVVSAVVLVVVGAILVVAVRRRREPASTQPAGAPKSTIETVGAGRR